MTLVNLVFAVTNFIFSLFRKIISGLDVSKYASILLILYIRDR